MGRYQSDLCSEVDNPVPPNTYTDLDIIIPPPHTHTGTEPYLQTVVFLHGL